VAAYLGLPVSTLCAWRTRGKGPVAHRLGKHLRFAVGDTRPRRGAPRTRETYEWNMRKLVLPVFANLTPREIGVARCDNFIKGLAKRSYSRARQVRNV
jgi:hypothetical protein